MIVRSRWAAIGVAGLLVAACQSVRPQAEPAVSTDPGALGNSPAPAETEAVPTPTATATATPAPPPTATPKPRHISYNSVEGTGKVIAMTFDDGPHPKLTPKLLDMLKERGIKATFFVVGQNAEEYPDIMRRIVAEGHEVGNHSWSHPALTRLGSEGVRSQIERTNAAIEKATGKPPTLIRPPYGATTARLDKVFADTFGLTVVIWSVDPLDWKYRNSARVTQKILEGASPGGIILAHDIHATTVAAMPATLDALKERGYKFATVSELIEMEDQATPVVASAAPQVPATSAAPNQPTPTPLSLPTDFEVNRYEVNDD